MGLNVIMMGPPGAGKGTQAGRFAAARGVPKISTGDILREAVREGNPTALEAKARMDQGELVDDAAMIEIVRERLSRPDVANGFVLDGFPRTVAQAEALDRLIAERGTGAPIVVDIDVPEAELIRRLASRLICSSCGANAGPSDGGTCRACGGQLVQRSDDGEGIVRERLRVYRQSTRPVLDYYRDRPTFREVNGAQAPERVTADLDAAVDEAAGAALRKGRS